MSTQDDQARCSRFIDAEFEALGSADSLYLKVHSAAGATKWISATPAQVEKIRKILKEPK